MKFDISNPLTEQDRKFAILVNRMSYYMNNENFELAKSYKNSLIDHVKKERQILSQDSMNCFRWLFLENIKHISSETDYYENAILKQQEDKFEE